MARHEDDQIFTPEPQETPSPVIGKINLEVPQRGPLEVTAFNGDVMELPPLDAWLISSSNRFLRGEAPFENLIYKLAGKEPFNAARDFAVGRESQGKSLGVGEAVVTGAGNLKGVNKLIFSAVTDSTQQEEPHMPPANISTAISRALIRAEDEGIGSLGTPFLGTGYMGVPAEVSAVQIANGIGTYLKYASIFPTSRRGVDTFYVFTHNATRRVENALRLNLLGTLKERWPDHVR
jgi:O-acetyl-ADP-ribose deacetylase (regulator of RNase III)